MDAVLREIGFTVTAKFNLTKRAMEETVHDFAKSVHPGELGDRRFVGSFQKVPTRLAPHPVRVLAPDPGVALIR